MEKFSGHIGDEGVEDFLDAVMLSFMPQEIYYKEADYKEKTRLLFLSSILEDTAKKWWRSIARTKRDTWTKATAMFKTRFATRVFPMSSQEGSQGQLAQSSSVQEIELFLAPNCLESYSARRSDEPYTTRGTTTKSRTEAELEISTRRGN